VLHGELQPAIEELLLDAIETIQEQAQIKHRRWKASPGGGISFDSGVDNL